MFAKPLFLDTDKMTTQELFERLQYILSSPRSRCSVNLAGIAEYYLESLKKREDAQLYLQHIKRLQNHSSQMG